MRFAKSAPLRSLLVSLAFLGGAVGAAFADDAAAGAPAASSPPPAPQSAMIGLIDRLAVRGALTKQDAAVLRSQAEADAADARVQAAEVMLAAAKADAAAARAQAALAQAEAAQAGVAQMVAAQTAAARILSGSAAAPAEPAAYPAPAQPSASVPAPTVASPESSAPPVAVQAAPLVAAAEPPVAPPVLATQAPQAEAAPQAEPYVAPVPPAPADTSAPASVAAEAPAPVAEPPAAAAPVVPAASAGADNGAPADDSVRVAYVPEVVKDQLREEVKNEVLAEARKENWGSAQPFPEWVSRFTLYGDVRVRYEFLYNHKTNDDSGNAFPDFNAINTGSPLDLAGNVAEPQYNVDQDRDRMRLRARMGAAIDLTDGFTAGLRLATGNDDQPVSENQTLGASGSGQGGDFSKYAVWLDLAYLKYQTGGDPSRDLAVTLGRFQNPFFSTTMLWATDLNFDGVAASLPMQVHWDGRVLDSVKPFFVVGAFPVFNTDLNFASDNSAKFASYNKWLDAAQVGASWTAGEDFDFKAAAAYYYYVNIQGQLSAPFTPLTSSDAGNTDDSRPSFAQNGNTYMEIRDIAPGPLNGNGTTDQFQYFGLATPFHDLTFTGRAAYNHFDPYQLSLTGEFVENLAFNGQAIAAQAVNNLGTAPAGGGPAPFIGGNKGWNVILKYGDAVLQRPGNWDVSVGYRHLESDAVVDAFTDADFGGDLLGTNLQGFTLDGNLELSPGVRLEAKWMSASAIAGPSYKNDYLQFDINGKF
jgi:hypothetical protein